MDNQEQTPESLRAKARELQAEAAKCEREASALEQRQKLAKLEEMIVRGTCALRASVTVVTFWPDDAEYALEIETVGGYPANLTGADAARLIDICKQAAGHWAAYSEASAAARELVCRHTTRPRSFDDAFRARMLGY